MSANWSNLLEPRSKWFSPLDFAGSATASDFLVLLEANHWALPTHIGNAEPLQTKYTSRQEALGHWQDPFLWKNSEGKLEGSIWFGRGKAHSCIFLRLKPRPSDNGTSLRNFLVACCEKFQADFGYVHLTTSTEMTDPKIPYDFSY